MLELTVSAGEQRHVLVLPQPKEPRLLAALGTRIPAEQDYDPNRQVLRFSAEAPEGAVVRYTIYSPAPPRKLTRGGETLNHDWAPQSRLIRFSAAQRAGIGFELEF
jgi:sarcosine oxidase gamma subunit